MTGRMRRPHRVSEEYNIRTHTRKQLYCNANISGRCKRPVAMMRFKRKRKKNVSLALSKQTVGTSCHPIHDHSGIHRGRQA